MLQLVVHVEGDYHRTVHVDKLGGKVEVALKVGGHHYVDHYVGHLVAQIASHIQLFGRIACEGVCTGEVYDIEAVASVAEVAALGVDSHSAVVAHMLLGS